jgi:hypothetical protein
MDHREAVRLQAVEKYTLGELSLELREQFEEHYVECSECANDVDALSKFVTASRLIFEGQTTKAQSQEARPRWLSWFRPLIAIPALAALVVIVVFQNRVTIPALKQQAATKRTTNAYSASYRVAGTSRGENATRIVVGPNENFALDFDFIPALVYEGYQGALVAPSAKTLFTFAVAGEEANKELHVVVPGGTVEPGTYALVFVGRNGTMNANPSNSEVQRLSFTVAFR